MNKKDFGKKVRPDALVALAPSLVGATKFEILRQSSMTNGDRLEAAYRSYSNTADGISRDAFIGLLLDGKVNVAGYETGATEPIRIAEGLS